MASRRGGQGKWADQEDDETAELNVPKEEIIPQEDGTKLKIITIYTLNEKNQRIKTVKKIKIFKTKVRINKQVEKRKQWRKFGAAVDDVGATTTSVADEVTLDLVLPSGPVSGKETPAAPQEKQKSLDMSMSAIVCRNCGRTGHWTMKCPYGKLDKPLNVPEALRVGAEPSSPAPSSGGKSAYRPPALRGRKDGGGGGEEEEAPSPRQQRDEFPTIRITNLPEETVDQDLSDLCKPFGYIYRMNLVKDHATGLCRGSAYVSFRSTAEAQKAIDKLNGVGFNHLILRVDWAKPSN